MDENHQHTVNSNQATPETKLWLPPSYTNNKAPIAPAPKKRGINWGFANRTVFDWAMLVSQVLGAIAIPFVVTMLGLYFTQQFTQQQNQLSEKQHQTDLQIAQEQYQNNLKIAQDQQQETTLKTCMDDIRDLLLNRGLISSKPNDDVRVLARAEVLSTLPQLDGIRKGILLQFLYDLKLINNDNNVISLQHANLEGVEIDAAFANHQLGFAIFAAGLSNANLRGADMSNASLDFASLQGANLQFTNLKGASLIGAFLENANILTSDLTGADLYGADLDHAGLVASILTGADLSYAYLGNANLSAANLNNANLTNADLSNAYLQGATLQNASLVNADLKGAILNTVNLSGAKVTNKQLAQAKSLTDATMPDGSIHS